MVAGDDAESFLQGLLTNSALAMTPGEIRYAALLTPQGKIIADMLLTKAADGFLIDCDAGISAALAKRLGMFRLRAKVEIAVRADLGVMAFAGKNDPRSDEAPTRMIGSRDGAKGDTARYHLARIMAGVAEQGIDFGAEEVFPADINMDLAEGIDFRKGCFVGQEVVSRMKRRGIARRRTLVAEASIAVPAPCSVLAGGHEIGTVTSAAGTLTLARVRIDRMAEAEAAGEVFTAGGAALTFRKPVWLADELAALAEAKESRV